MRHRLTLIFSLMLISCFSAFGERKFHHAVKEAVMAEMKAYPKSTLKDFYKNFFQDKFGPGHLVTDTASAGKYLRSELASCTDIKGALYEQTGWQGNFIRVNLSVIKNGQISYEHFFDAFLESVNNIQKPTIKQWTNEWSRIEKIIRSMNLNLPNYEADKNFIDANLKAGIVQGEHSEVFVSDYSPHYRIIARKIFYKEIYPFLK